MLFGDSGDWFSWSPEAVEEVDPTEQVAPEFPASFETDEKVVLSGFIEELLVPVPGRAGTASTVVPAIEAKVEAPALDPETFAAVISMSSC